MTSDMDSAVDDAPRVRLMCSLGGRILPRPHDNQLRYVGGDTRIVAVHRSSTFSALHDKLAKLAGIPDVDIKYQLPNEDLDALISVTADDDVDNMMEEHDRLAHGPPPNPASGGAGAARNPRLRIFLFPPGSDAGGFGSILGSSGSKRDSWFLDVLNGGSGSGLERGRSDASSLVSEVPDYLFGLDNNSDEPKPSPRYSSTSSVAAPPIPEAGYTAAVWQYAPEPVPVYYMPGPGPVPGPVRPFYMGGPPPGYSQPVQRVWTNLNRSGPVYMGGPPAPPPPVSAAVYNYPAGDEVPGGGGGMLRSPGMMPVYPAAAAGELPGMELRMNRASQ